MAIRTPLAAIAAAVLVWGLVGCGDKSRDPAKDVVSSRAYKGHADDQVIHILMAAYPGGCPQCPDMRPSGYEYPGGRISGHCGHPPG